MEISTEFILALGLVVVGIGIFAALRVVQIIWKNLDKDTDIERLEFFDFRQFTEPW